MKQTDFAVEELDQELDGLIRKIADRSAGNADLARYNELTITRIQQSHFTREMAMDAMRRYSR